MRTKHTINGVTVKLGDTKELNGETYKVIGFENRPALPGYYVLVERKTPVTKECMEEYYNLGLCSEEELNTEPTIYTRVQRFNDEDKNITQVFCG
jgi:hypothetical protein